MRSIYDIVFAGMALFGSSFGQQVANEALMETDRELYFVGEHVFYTMIDPTNGIPVEKGSRVMELSLYDEEGAVKAFQTEVMEGLLLSNRFLLPEMLTSGIYLVQAKGAGIIARKFIQVINPNKKPNWEHAQVSMTSIRASNSNPDLGSIGLDKDRYSCRETITGTLAINREYGRVDGVLSATKRYFKRPDLDVALSNQKKGEDSNGNSIPYLPINGVLRNPQSGEPYGYRKITAYFAGGEAHLLKGITDDQGVFTLGAPVANLGKRDLVFQAAGLEGPIEVEIIRPNPVNEIVGEFPSFNLVHSSALDSAFFNWQGCLKYQEQLMRLMHQSLVNDSLADFYGIPYARVYRKDFIRLKNIREFFKEVGYGVKVRGKAGEERLVVLEESSSLTKRNSPIVLFNGHPIKNESDILDLPLDLLDYFDVIREDYFLGDTLFGGLVNVVSVDPTYNLEIPLNAFRSVEKLTEPRFKFNVDQKEWVESTIPLVSPTLMYENVTLENEGTRGFEFFAGDDPGWWMVTFSGISEEGARVEFNTEFQIVRDELK